MQQEVWVKQYFLLNFYIHLLIVIFCRTFNEQDQWRLSGFIAKNFKYLNEEYAKGKLLVFDDRQLDMKGNKLVETLFFRGSQNKTEIIQCEQFT